MVGRYHVDVAAFEGLALPAVQRAALRGGVAIIDELGQMELFLSAFISSFNRLLDLAVPLVATVHARQHPVPMPSNSGPTLRCWNPPGSCRRAPHICDFAALPAAGLTHTTTRLSTPCHPGGRVARLERRS